MLKDIGNLESFPGSTKNEINCFVEFFDNLQISREEKSCEEEEFKTEKLD